MPADLDDVRTPDYGHFLEDFVPGTVFVHPRGRTVGRDFMLDYATTFMEANPLYLNEEFARSQGYEALPAAPHLVMNLALSLGVQNDSEKAIANLGYYDVRFVRPVYPGDTLMARTQVVARRDRGVGKPGIATVHTLAQNQRGEVVCQYRRKIFVPRRTDQEIDPEAKATDQPAFPWDDSPTLSIPMPSDQSPAAFEGVTTPGTLLGELKPGRVFVHKNGRTVTDEHLQWTYKVMNTHPLHYDRLYSTGRKGPMSGEPIVYGGLVFAWLLGLASRDTSENGVWELGWHDGYHTQPTFAGDTVSSLSRVLSVEEISLHGGEPDAGIVRFQLVGVKNVRAEEALERFGVELFERENDKKKAGKDKIPEKIFEIEREVLVRKDLP
ncbi:MAG: MaoC family dehydratase [Myxococcota bacterium]